MPTGHSQNLLKVVTQPRKVSKMSGPAVYNTHKRTNTCTYVRKHTHMHKKREKERVWLYTITHQCLLWDPKARKKEYTRTHTHIQIWAVKPPMSIVRPQAKPHGELCRLSDLYLLVCARLPGDWSESIHSLRLLLVLPARVATSAANHPHYCPTLPSNCQSLLCQACRWCQTQPWQNALLMDVCAVQEWPLFIAHGASRK